MKRQLELWMIFYIEHNLMIQECLFWGTSWKDKHPITGEKLDLE